MIAAQLQDIQQQISDAAQRAGRDPGTVRLIAVSKTHPIEAVREAAAAGQVHFGENRVQELCDKQALMPDLKWHMIGGLQRNKVKYLVDFVHLIHSVDSERLLQEIDKQAAKADRIVPCLLQLNISDEDQKGGLTEAEAEQLLRRITDFPHVEIRGLMGMAEFTDDEAVIRAQFRRLAAARERFRDLPSVNMDELSMGMSGDFEIAIEEGATLIRVGSSIFGHRDYQ